MENNAKFEKSSRLQSDLRAFRQNKTSAPSIQGIRKQKFSRSIKKKQKKQTFYEVDNYIY